MRSVSRGCAVQRTILSGALVRGHGMCHLGHRMSNVHLEPKGELQRQEREKDTNEG